MALLTVYDPQQIAGANCGTAVGSASDTFPVSDGESYLVYVDNTSGSLDSISFDDPTSPIPEGASGFNPDPIVSVAAGAKRVFRIQASRFKNPATGLVTMTHSQTTLVNVIVFRAGRV